MCKKYKKYEKYALLPSFSFHLLFLTQFAYKYTQKELGRRKHFLTLSYPLLPSPPPPSPPDLTPASYDFYLSNCFKKRA
jgi:hypothetical protein